MLLLLMTTTILFASSVQSLNIPLDTKMCEMPILMAHDAATTYLKHGTLVRISTTIPSLTPSNIHNMTITQQHPIDQWTKTQQDGGVKGILDCGARSLDMRAKLKDGKLISHHGVVDVDYAMSDVLNELLSWLDAHETSPENLVLMNVANCDGDGCFDALDALFASKNITRITDCATYVNGKTIGEIMAMSTLKGQHNGAFMVYSGCHDSNYDETIACSGFGDKRRRLRSGMNEEENVVRSLNKTKLDLSLTYSCYADSSTKDFPLNRMWNYVKSIVEVEPTTYGRMYSLQALWQETDSSVFVGEAHFSSLLEDEVRSQLNALVTQKIISGEIDSSKLNLVEMNNVCDGGADVVKALYEKRGWE